MENLYKQVFDTLGQNESYVQNYFKCNLEKLHDILKTLKNRSTFVTKSRQSFKKELEHRTLNSVLQSIRESLMEPIINEENLIA